MNDLFAHSITNPDNLLPQDGTVHYYGQVFAQTLSDSYYQALLADIAWRNDEAVIYGKHIITKRKVAWYGDSAYDYTYSNTTKQALPWTDTLLYIKTCIEQASGESYNSCLLNLYHTGSEGMAWHSDGERELKKNGAIASVSFGAVRKFCFKHKETAEVIAIQLAHGSLLVMKDTTQSHWLHRLPTTTRVHTPRINLTFRQMNIR
jgi:alkylated DNA repair dioxygenase AlkB